MTCCECVRLASPASGLRQPKASSKKPGAAAIIDQLRRGAQPPGGCLANWGRPHSVPPSSVAVRPRQTSLAPTALPPEAIKRFNGRDALRRVRDGKPNTDAEHRVPTRSSSYDQPNIFRASAFLRGNCSAPLALIPAKDTFCIQLG